MTTPHQVVEREVSGSIAAVGGKFTLTTADGDAVEVPAYAPAVVSRKVSMTVRVFGCYRSVVWEERREPIR